MSLCQNQSSKHYTANFNQLNSKGIKAMKRTFILLLLIIFSSSLSAKTQPPGYAVASASPYATRAGMKILAQGGNAFDAAVTVSAVLAVTEPYHSGIGGGGFWLLYDAKHNNNIVVDGREVAPLGANKHMYLDARGKPIKDASLFGPLAAAIPGEPAALVYIAKQYGRLPLKTVLAPAIELAEQGFPADEAYISIIENPRIRKNLDQHLSTTKIYLEKEKTPKAGDMIIQKDLAKTLKILSEQGAQGFYEGDIAKKLVSEVRKAGGIWTLEDLKNYKIKIRKPLIGQYKDIKIITTPPPSAGGIALLTMLGILDSYQLNQLRPPMRIHKVAEAMKLAYWDRANYLGDPDFIRVPVQGLLSKGHLKTLQAYLKHKKATASNTLPVRPEAFSDSSENTSHFSIIDSEGNRVGATMSINYLFGSGFVAEGTGVLLNNEMDDFSIKPGVRNAFGLIGSIPNQITPNKRPLSSMSPTFLIAPDRLAIFGTPGGSRIPTMLLLSTLAFEQGKGPLSMVSIPRYHHQYIPDVIQYENDAFDSNTIKSLLAMGHRLKKISKVYGGRYYYYGDMQAIEWNIKDDAIFASSDPRHIGLAEVHYNVNKKGSE